MPNPLSPPSTDPRPEPLVFLRLPEVERRVGFKRATIYRLLAADDNDFPRPVKLFGNSTPTLGRAGMSFWPEHEVNAWLAKKIAARDQAQQVAA